MDLRVSTDVLHVYYDLDCAPVTFDFTNFLVIAEMHRQHQNRRAIHLHLIPGKYHGFRGATERDLAMSVGEKNWFLHNLIMQSTELLPSVENLYSYKTHAEAYSAFQLVQAAAKDAIFPTGYDMATKRFSCYTFVPILEAHNHGLEAQPFCPPKEALTYVRRWLDQRIGAGQIPLSITLREATLHPGRNSDLQEWAKFLGALDRQKYAPIIMRDSFAAAGPVPQGFEDYLFFSEGLFNIAMRGALYEACTLNLFVSNGSAHLAYFNKRVNFLGFKNHIPDVYTCSKEFLDKYGLTIDEQQPYFGDFQRMTWTIDSCENIQLAFDDMMVKINTSTSPRAATQ
jgi:hypothetical protein